MRQLLVSTVHFSESDIVDFALPETFRAAHAERSILRLHDGPEAIDLAAQLLEECGLHHWEAESVWIPETDDAYQRTDSGQLVEHSGQLIGFNADEIAQVITAQHRLQEER